MQAAELFAQGEGVAIERARDGVPLQPLGAEADEGLLFFGEIRGDVLGELAGAGVHAGGGVGRGDLGRRGAGRRESVALQGGVVAGEVRDLAADDALQVGGKLGLGAESDAAGVEVINERAGDGLADIGGFAVVAQAAAHGGADGDHDEPEEFGEGALALLGGCGRSVAEGAEKSGGRRHSGGHGGSVPKCGKVVV